MTVRAILHIKMNRLILAPPDVVETLSRLMQMNQITVRSKAFKGTALIKVTVLIEHLRIIPQSRVSAKQQRRATKKNHKFVFSLNQFHYVLVVIHLVDFSLQA